MSRSCRHVFSLQGCTLGANLLFSLQRNSFFPTVARWSRTSLLLRPPLLRIMQIGCSSCLLLFPLFFFLLFYTPLFSPLGYLYFLFYFFFLFLSLQSSPFKINLVPKFTKPSQTIYDVSPSLSPQAPMLLPLESDVAVGA